LEIPKNRLYSDWTRMYPQSSFPLKIYLVLSGDFESPHSTHPFSCTVISSLGNCHCNYEEYQTKLSKQSTYPLKNKMAITCVVPPEESCGPHPSSKTSPSELCLTSVHSQEAPHSPHSRWLAQPGTVRRKRQLPQLPLVCTARWQERNTLTHLP